MITNSLPQSAPGATILQFALTEAKAGRRVFLLSPGSKKPLKDSEGFYDATSDEAEITRLFALHPFANYGIALAASDLILDADPRNYPPGRDVMLEIMQNFQLPRTRVVGTPSGGFHFYFTKPAARKIKIKQALFPGIDFLSEGAYIVGPGSIVDGKVYQIL